MSLTRSAGRVLLVAVLELAALTPSGPIAAQAREITLRSCDSLREDDLHRALESELQDLPAAVDEGRGVVVECAGDVAVMISMAGRESTQRAVDVSDVPARLRARVIALSIAEMLLAVALESERARAEAAASAAASATVAAAPSASAPAPAPMPAPETASAPAPATAVVPSPPSASPAGPASSPTADLPGAPRARAGRSALVRVSLDGTRPRTPGVAALARATMRNFPRLGDLLGGGDALVRLGPLALGVHASAGLPRRDVLGELRASLVLGLAEVAIACADHSLVELCGAMRVAVGRAAVDARPADAAIDARFIDAPFIEGSLVLSFALAFDAVALSFDVSAGWAEGLIALSDTREVLALAGPSVALSISLEVLP